MKKNLIDYVKQYQKLTFEECTMREADLLVFAEFSYIKLDGVVKSIDEVDQKGYTLWEIEKLADRDVLFADERFRAENEALFDAMLASKRYAKCKFRFYENLIDHELEMQFSAVTVTIDEGLSIVVYRGTDEYFISWKEDFNLSFMDKVPGQVCAKQYLKRVAEQVSGDLYVCGHSKGGNLAVYAAMCADTAIQDRMIAVYDFDGPGFLEKVLEENHFMRIAPKVHKIIPKASLVGMLLGNHESCRVVESSSVGLSQHLLFHWIIENGELKYTDKMLEGSKHFDKKLNTWINGLSMEERKIFTDTLFDVAFASETDNLVDIKFDKESLKGVALALDAAKNLPKDTKDKMFEIIRELVKVSMEPSWVNVDFQGIQRFAASLMSKKGNGEE